MSDVFSAMMCRSKLRQMFVTVTSLCYRDSDNTDIFLNQLIQKPYSKTEADLGMFSMFGRTGSPTKRGPTRGHGPKITMLLRNIQ